MKCSIGNLLFVTAIVAFALTFHGWLRSPGVMVKRQREVEELWFEHDAQVWTDRHLREWGLRK
jgi:hypothetical protein